MRGAQVLVLHPGTLIIAVVREHSTLQAMLASKHSCPTFAAAAVAATPSPQLVGRCLNASGGFANRKVNPLVRWERYVIDITNVTFIQLGANAGRSQHDPVWEYATLCGWRGLAFEPGASTFASLCENYAPAFPLIQPVRAAVSDVRGDGYLEAGSSFCPNRQCEHLLPRGVATQGRRVQPVHLVTLEDAWTELRVRETRVDLLVLDVSATCKPDSDRQP